jgi:hypothetical protein
LPPQAADIRIVKKPFYLTQQWLKAIVSIEMCSFEKQKMWQYHHTFSYLIIPQIAA